MNEIILQPIKHEGKVFMGVFFENKPSLNNLVRKISEAKWSQTNKCWYIPLEQASYSKLKKAVQDKANLEISGLKKYLEQQKKLPMLTLVPVSKNPATQPKEKQTIFSGLKIQAYVSAVNKQVLPAMEQLLKLKAYSASTIRTYLNEMSQLLAMIKDIPADELKPEHMKRYLVYCYEKLELKENTLHSRINAMKFYYEQVLGREKFFWEIPRPKKPLLLPKLLNETELAKLFNALTNKKHKAMLFTIYSAGLRVSEIVNLRIRDIDSQRMQIFIERAKGKKDRVVNLSPVLLDILRGYIKSYKPRPIEFLFESEQTFTAYPTRTVQQIFSNAKAKAGIRKVVGIHSLRHSFATHLLDKGTDIKYIKELLGHFDIKTTERYLHVSKRQLVNIISPFDDLWKNNTIEW